MVSGRAIDVASGLRLTWLGPLPLVIGDGVQVAFSPDSGFLATSGADLTVFETGAWSEIARISHDEGWWWDLEFSPDGRYLLGPDTPKGVVRFDTSTWEYVGEPFSSRGGMLRDIDVSRDGSMIATADFDGFVDIWDSRTGDLIQTIPVGDTRVSVSSFLEEQHLLVIPVDRPAMVVTIDVSELIDIARSQVTRSFTEGECTTYHIDPCPTLEEIQSGSA